MNRSRVLTAAMVMLAIFSSLFINAQSASALDGVRIYRASNGSLCLDVQTDPSTNWGLATGAHVQQWTCNGAGQQNWTFKDTGFTAFFFGQTDSVYQIVNSRSGDCLDVTNRSYSNGAPIQQWPCLGPSQTNQLWAYHVRTDFYCDPAQNCFTRTSVNLISYNSAMCLDVPGGTWNNGARLQQWDCNGNDAQKFY